MHVSRYPVQTSQNSRHSLISGLPNALARSTRFLAKARTVSLTSPTSPIRELSAFRELTKFVALATRETIATSSQSYTSFVQAQLFHPRYFLTTLFSCHSQTWSVQRTFSAVTLCSGIREKFDLKQFVAKGFAGDCLQ